jgi:hydrogenase assembly chaperone HypC/HupF
MCVSMLAQVVAVDSMGATVSCGGMPRRAATRLYPDIAAGEWVLVGAGTILQRLSADEARRMASTQAFAPEWRGA